MALSIQQSQEYTGNGRWRWAVWLDGTEDELDAVDEVTYILDSTFKSPVRPVRDRATKFRIETSTWGAFTLHARVAYRDGRETVLVHDLVLVYPDGAPALV